MTSTATSDGRTLDFGAAPSGEARGLPSGAVFVLDFAALGRPALRGFRRSSPDSFGGFGYHSGSPHIPLPTLTISRPFAARTRMLESTFTSGRLSPPCPIASAIAVVC